MTALTLSEIGAMLKEITKATPNNNPFHEKIHEYNFVKSKSDATREIGFTPKQVSQFQRMADNEETVMEAIAEASKALLDHRGFFRKGVFQTCG